MLTYISEIKMSGGVNVEQLIYHNSDIVYCRGLAADDKPSPTDKKNA